MADPTPIPAVIVPPPPKIPTGQELFDAIMGHIEPELTTEGIKDLETRYAAETPQQADARRKRYTLAFDRYEQAYEGYMATLHAQVMRFRRASFDQVETEDRQDEGGFLQALSQKLSLA